ncbi:MAG: Mg-dependent DNase [Candidatus Giovannonibacteria bacterium GW2011_GWA2_53_7]|uniref:Mg-dependent DNase n=1 Tax=Candidatus Giovannonibacteria bacterium GW2011_GWA2_53_7 TaxID=1618650 RepID=A0A0G1XVB5_9BACT|nr:MAG: Mg-dependent DNase [Candidatus Giovannonibacteria bacterium GW2011_GWA2_53_7]
MFDREAYRALATSSKKVVAIGEVGLDYYRLPSDEADTVVAAQKEHLGHALDLADELNLPVVLHVRDAHASMMAMLGAYRGVGRLARRGVVHCFTGTVDEARAYHALGFLTSFTGIVTFVDRKHPDELTELMKTVQALPLEMMLVETDAPYLAPQAHRGKRNEPWMVTLVAPFFSGLLTGAP